MENANAEMVPVSKKRVYTIREVSQELQLCEKTIRRLIDRGMLARLKGVRHVRVPSESLEAFLKSK
jgi:excisionase family DNA binding protein